MALNKRKVLDSARKLAQKGAKAKALKEYQLLLQADPRDAKLLLEVGDTYRRWGQNEDAIAQYAKVAQQYRQDGFDARAVAVYKQILNLDSKHYAAYVSLSELYQRMGLDGEAIGALQTAADGYHREGRKSDALELLRQMAGLDPTNVTNRLKVAELLRQEKMTSEALAEYEAAARELESQQDRDQLIAVRQRILELKPDHVGALSGMVRLLMISGELERAEPFAVRAVSASSEPAQYELLIELFAQMGNDAKLAEATRGLAKLYRDRGNEDKARELMQRLPTDEVGARSRLAVDVSEVDEPEIADDELLDEDPFITVSGSKAAPVLALGEDELELDDEEEIQLELPSKPVARASTRPTPAPSAGNRTPQLAPEGDPDQLLAEASVYLRYGKRAQAIQTLRAILEQDANHRAALEKLGEAYVDEGQPAEAVAVWLRAGSLIRETGDTQALSVLRDRIATLDPDAARQLVIDAPKSKPAATRDAGPAELELELDLAVEEMDEDAGAASEPAEAEGLEFEVDLDGDSHELGRESVSSSASEPPHAAHAELADDGGIEFELDPDELSDDGEGSVDESDAGIAAAELDVASDIETGSVEGAGSVSRPGTTTTTARIQEELEEAEFYIAQEMYDEAEGILARILELAPGHPSAMLRMGEIQVARGATPEAAPTPVEPRTKAGRKVAGVSPMDLGSTARFEDGLDLSSDALLAADAGAHDESPPDSASQVLRVRDEDSLAAKSSALDLAGDVEIDVDVDVDVEVGLGGDLDAAVDVEVDGISGLSLDDASRGGIDVALAGEDATSCDAESLADGDSESGLELDVDRVAPSARAGETSQTEPIARAAGDSVAVLSGGVGAPASAGSETAAAISVVRPMRESAAAVAAPAMAASTRDAAPMALDSTVQAERALPAAFDAPAGDEFDLRAALSDVFAEPDSSARGRAGSGAPSTVEDGFASIFSDFKRGVSATLGQGDVETRYDLGIAYREMGLFEDAIGEFAICLESPHRRFDSLYLMGLCARDLGRPHDAVHHLEQALALPDVPDERMAGVFFELALSQAAAGGLERARANMRRVLELEPSFPNAVERLAELESASTESAAGFVSAGTGFESFDDLFSEDAEAGATSDPESFESFDDVVSEVRDVAREASVSPSAASNASAAARSAETTLPSPVVSGGEANEKSSRKPGRKKISFV